MITGEPSKHVRCDDSVVRVEHRRGERLLEPSLAAVDNLRCDTVVAGLCSDVRPLAGALAYLDWRLCGRLSALVRSGAITGADGEKVLYPTLQRITPERILLLGWGERKKMLDGADGRFAAMMRAADELGARRIAVVLPEPAADLAGLVQEHLADALGERLVGVFLPDPLPPV